MEKVPDGLKPGLQTHIDQELVVQASACGLLHKKHTGRAKARTTNSRRPEPCYGLTLSVSFRLAIRRPMARAIAVEPTKDQNGI